MFAFAAFALARLGTWARERGAKNLGAAALAFCALFAATRLDGPDGLRPGQVAASSLINLAGHFAATGLLPEAETRSAYVRALKADPNLPQAHYNLGNLLLREGRLKPAEARYRRALALRPDYARALDALGLVELRRGNRSGARAFFSKALKADPELAEARTHLRAAGYRIVTPFNRKFP